MRRGWKGAFEISWLAWLGGTVAGCVYDPVNGDLQCPGSAFTLQGFASAPGAALEVEAFNDDSDVWEVVTDATASTGGVTFGGQTLFPFSASVELGEQHFTPFTPDAFASIRVREVGGALALLVTYDSDGVGCVVDQVFDGEDWFAAGFECRSDTSPLLSLVCVG